MAANQMTYKLLRKFVEAEIKSTLDGKEQEFSFLVEGPHGIGKSAFWKQICLDFNGYFVDVRLGQRDLGDIIGLPTIEVDPQGIKHMVHIKPELIRKMFVKDLNDLGLMGDPFDEVTYRGDKLGKNRPKEAHGKPYQFILGFLDEYNRGTKDVQQAVFELVYDRSMNGDTINSKTILAAACNDNIEIYTITEGDPAFRSRFKTIKFAPTVEEWLNWGRKTRELCDELIFVIESKKDLADPPKGKDLDYLNQPHPNRRSWHEFSKFYIQFRSQFTEIEMRDICATFVGHDSAEIFRLQAGKMVTTKKAAASAQTSETKKVEDFYNGFLRIHKMPEEQAKKELEKFNPSDMQALADHCIVHFNMFNYMTGVSKDRIEGLAEMLPQEIFARIWNSVDDRKTRLRTQMVDHLTKKGKADYFGKFSKDMK